MVSISEKAISILAGNLNSGRSYLITAVFLFLLSVCLSVQLNFGGLRSSEQAGMLPQENLEATGPIWRAESALPGCDRIKVFENLCVTVVVPGLQVSNE